jgi:hypothetical protein
MGLMLQFPVSEEEVDRVTIDDKGITLKSYGLPMVFWGYLAAILTVIFAMALAVKQPMEKLYATGDQINKIMVIVVAITIIAIPFVMITAYFYEKFITKKGNELIITHRFYWIPLFTSHYQLDGKDAFELSHHMDSPNVAKMKNDPALRGFQNKGYFQLFARKANGQHMLLDRSNRKMDLEKIKNLLIKY